MHIALANDMPKAIRLNERPQLSMRVLHTSEQRLSIAELRRLSPVGVEDDLGLGLSPFENVRDQIGTVLAYERDRRLVATLRFVPSGHGMTGLERLLYRAALPKDIVTPHSCEVGRVVVAPEDRHPDMLGQCFSLALVEITRMRPVKQFYAIATPLVARLWRRYGMQVAATIHGVSGTEYKVIQGRAVDVAKALKLPKNLLMPGPSPAASRAHVAAASRRAMPIG